jgi:hypothetical protein
MLRLTAPIGNLKAATAVAGLFRSRAALQTEVLAIRHQLNILMRRAPKRVAVSNIDRLVFAGLYQLAVPVGNSNSNILMCSRPRSATNPRALCGAHHAEPVRPSAAIGAF